MNFNSQKNTLSLIWRSLNSFGSSKKALEKIRMSSILQTGLKNQKQKVLSSRNEYFYLNSMKDNRFFFCTGQNKSKKAPLKPQQIPKQNLQIVTTQEHVGQQDVQVFHTKGTLSILDKVPGVKHQQSGQLYVLSFTCTVCQAKSIRSFTKNAYHKGVVMVRCNGCDNIHLVADNLGWFQDQPTNVQKLHEGKVKRVHDQGVINMFLQKAFQQQKALFQQAPHQHSQHCSHNHDHGVHNNQNKKDSSTQKQKE